MMILKCKPIRDTDMNTKFVLGPSPLFLLNNAEVGGAYSVSFICNIYERFKLKSLVLTQRLKSSISLDN